MIRAVIDTNVLRVAAKQHRDASDKCVDVCGKKLVLMQREGVVFIDDNYKVING